MSVLASRPVPQIAAEPTQTRAVRLVATIRAMPIQDVRQRIEEARAMTDEQLRNRHIAETRARAVASAERMSSR